MKRTRTSVAIVEPAPAAATKRAPHADEQQLAERLIEHKVVDAPVVDRAVRNLGEAGLATALLRQGVTTEARLAPHLAAVSGLASVDLRSMTPQPEAVELVSESVARAFHAVPLAVEGGSLRVAIADPTNGAVARLAELLGRPVVADLAPAADVRRVIGNTYKALSAVGSRIQAFEAKDTIRREKAVETTITASDDAPVVQVAQMIITQALRDRASDIHIEPSEERIRVRYRIDGALHDVLSLPESIGPALISRLKILAGMNIVERRRPQDGQITMRIEGSDVDIRVSTTAVVGGEKVVMRVLDKSRPLFALTDLGMPDNVADRFGALLHSPYGMVICAGPTGSGKTTTLYASLQELNTPDRNIMTIEDPVEYTFPTINQIQINEQAGITFAKGLRSILRQDPDVILVGEVRDVDTARIAVQSALTGHFVLSSLHATDSVSALHRLLDMGIEGFLVVSAVTAVVAQRLVRRVCTYCRESYRPTRAEQNFLETVGASIGRKTLVRGAGCNFCSQTGYLDRIGIYELLTLNDTLRELILDRQTHDQLRKTAIAYGLSTLHDQVIDLVAAGTTTVAEAMRTIFVAGA